jgi:uncharacterized protein YciI
VTVGEGGRPDAPREALFVILSRATQPAERLEALLPAHRAWLDRLEGQDALFASGPLLGPEGPLARGLTIVRAATRQDAEELAAADPFVAHQARSASVHEWSPRRGRPRLRARLSPEGADLS